jgi:hypothetical protein
MKTKNGLHLPVIAVGLVLALSMNSLAFAVSEEPTPAQSTDQLPDSPGAVHNQSTQPVLSVPTPKKQSGQSVASVPVPTPAEHSLQPVPPMPPLPPEEQLAQSTQAEQDLTSQDLTSQNLTSQGVASEEQSSQNVPPIPAPQPQQQQTSPKEPLGTAAAETVPTLGVAASRPAGAALAPAKQRRVRTILIRMGAVIGVGAAVGATMALSEGSPSKPPGAH